MISFYICDMRRKNLRRVILFGSIVMMGLLFVQGFWMTRAFDIEERQFNHDREILFDLESQPFSYR